MVYAIRTGNGYFNTKRLSNREYELLIGSVENYAKLKSLGDQTSLLVKKRFNSLGNKAVVFADNQLVNDSQSIQKYSRWWARYFSEVTGKRNEIVSLASFDLAFTPQLSRLSPDSTLFTIKLPR
jgi:hypothetical protein